LSCPIGECSNPVECGNRKRKMEFVHLIGTKKRGIRENSSFYMIVLVYLAAFTSNTKDTVL
jgi:hypothetical protein